MGHLTLKGTLKKEDGSTDGVALLIRISKTLHGLVNSLEEFGEIESMLGLECTATVDHRGSHDRYTSTCSPDFLGFVAGTLKEMVGKLVLDIEATPEIQKLLLVIRNSMSSEANEGVIVQDALANPRSQQCQSLTILQPSSSIVGTVAPGGHGAEAVGTSCMHNSIRGRRAAVERALTCRHVCEHHPEVMDPHLWSTLPEALLQLVFARLPLAKVLDLCAQSSAWSAMSRASDFRQECSERHPKLFGLMALATEETSLHHIARHIVYDIQSDQWINRDLGGLDQTFDYPVESQMSSMVRQRKVKGIYACDGGLVCFVPRFLYSPVRIGNPLTDEWRALPCIPYFYDKKTVGLAMVELVTEEDTKCYKVKVVVSLHTNDYAAWCYCSKTGVWSWMESGLVYGYCILNSVQTNYPCVFDCTMKTMHNLRICSTIESLGDKMRQYAWVKDRLFVLHNDFEDWDDYKLEMVVLECEWQSSISDLRIINSYNEECLPIGYDGYFFATRGSFLLCEYNLVNKHQLFKFRDSSESDWHGMSEMGDHIKFTNIDLGSMSVFWCELRWDVVP